MRFFQKFHIVFFFMLSVWANAQRVSVNVALQESPSNAHLRGLWLVNEQIAWASGTQGTILKTTDGGTNWQKIVVAGYEDKDFRDIVAFDANKAFIINAGSPAYILQTKDGGASWQKVYENTSPKAFLDDIGFWNEKTGLVFGDPDEKGFFVLLKTEDYGATWQNIGERLPKAQENEAGFAASGTIMRFRDTTHIWIATGGGSSSRVLFSDNAGKTWTSFNTPIMAGKNSQGIFSMAFKDKKSGVAVGGDYTKPQESKLTSIYTKNGGKTWKLSKEFSSGYRSGVSYVSGNSYIATGTNGTDFSDNGGKSWQNVSSEGFNTIRFLPNQKIGWAVGNKGKIARITIL